MQQNYPVVEFTVELSRQLLVENKINRKVKPRTVDRYAQAMSDGAWPFIGGSIVTDDQGVLLDGQHRLLAIIKSGKPQKFILVGNMPRSIFDVLDTGRNRMAADVVHQIGDYQSPAMVASAARYLLIYEKSRVFDRNQARDKISNRAVLNVASKYPELDQRQRQLSAWMNSSSIKGIRRGMMLAIYIIMLRKDQALAEAFFRRVFVGEDLKRSDPEYMLRSRFIGRDRPNYDSEIGVVILTIKAWNAVRKSDPIKQLRVIENEKVPEIF